MQLLKKPLILSRLKQLALSRFGNLVKAVVDLEKKLMVVDAEMHADEEQFLLKQESHQENLWGINLYPDKFGTIDFIEFDSMINLKPAFGNRSRGIDNQEIREKVTNIVKKLVL